MGRPWFSFLADCGWRTTLEIFCPTTCALFTRTSANPKSVTWQIKKLKSQWSIIMINLYKIFKLLLQDSSSYQAWSQEQGWSGGCMISNIHASFLGKPEVPGTLRRRWIAQEGSMFYGQEVQGQHADKPACRGQRGSAVWGTEDKERVFWGAPTSRGGAASGRKGALKNCHQGRLSLSSWEKVKTKAECLRRATPFIRGFHQEIVASEVGRKLVLNRSHLV